MKLKGILEIGNDGGCFISTGLTRRNCAHEKNLVFALFTENSCIQEIFHKIIVNQTT
jgi:hypothetical protein